MRRFVLMALLVLAGCSDKAADTTAAPSVTTKLEAAPAADGAEPAAQTSAAVAGPQIAYAYRIGYRLPAARLAEAQGVHLKLCDALGTQHCRLIAQERRTGDSASGSMAFEVDSKLARGFADRLDAAVGTSGGTTTSRNITAEDLSRSIIDTEARIRAKQALADRLLDLIRTRNGKISELVEAEQAFADTQEILDAARSSLETMQRRISMSRIDTDYQPIGQAGGGDWAVRDAIDNAGLTLGQSVAALINLAMVTLPWLAIALALAWGASRWRRSRRANTGD